MAAMAVSCGVEPAAEHNCVEVTGFEVDTANNCHWENKPKVIGCLADDPEEADNQQTECYYNPDEQIVVFAPTTSAPYDQLPDLGYQTCGPELDSEAVRQSCQSP